jgi:formamidopyrimidine-DNA glycosylase
MPELPEVESARRVIARAGLDRRIADVDDTDTFVCRPHAPGEIKAALVGRSLVAVHRRGKSMWCDASPLASGDVSLGIHLGMSGKIVIADADGAEIDGGDYWERGRRPGDYAYARFGLTFEDGGRLLLVDPRRLGRVRLDPPVELLGPDATEIKPRQFDAAFATSKAPAKARLMDQHVVAGIGNLLADEIFWQARIHPARSSETLSPAERRRLLRSTRTAVDEALEHGGVHTLTLVTHRIKGGTCPRDGAPLQSAAVGGRTTYWCSREQRLD